MKLFQIQTDEEVLFVLAKSMPEALNNWRKWMVNQSEGMMSSANAYNMWPEGIHELAGEDQVVG